MRPTGFSEFNRQNAPPCSGVYCFLLMGVSPDKKAVFCQLSIYTKISTPPIRPEKWPNNRDKPASKGLQGVRDAARRDRQCRFTALLHHITPELLRGSFYKLSRKAATGVDGVSWRDYEPEAFPSACGSSLSDCHRARLRRP